MDQELRQRRANGENGGNNTTPPPSMIPTTPSIPSLYQPTKTPKETLYALYKAGQYKASTPMRILVVQSVMAGIFIAMAGHLYLAVGGGIFGAAVFPTGLIAVVLTSAELFTGDTLVFISSVLGGKVGFDNLVRNWTVAWFCNWFGCIVWASILTYASDALDDSNQTELAIYISEKKALQPFGHIFLKAIAANFMVCLGVWQSTAAEDVAGKILAIWFPISGFVMMGMEHVIANQYLIPLGMMYAGAAGNISVGRLLGAIIVCTLGNIVGGGLLVGAVYWYIYDSMNIDAQNNGETFWGRMVSALNVTDVGTSIASGDSNNHNNNNKNEEEVPMVTKTSSV